MGTNKHVPYWLFLAVSALGVAGAYSVMLVLLRTPLFAEFVPSANFFRSSLVVHVDMSVLVWFFAVQLGLISHYINNEYLLKTCLILAVAGALTIAVSPLFLGLPLINNYVPILQNFAFAFGLALFACAVLVCNIYAAISMLVQIRSCSDHRFMYALSSSLLTIFAAISIYISYIKLRQVNYVADFGVQDYFERLFWGGGHIMQFIFLQLVQFAWIRLYERINGTTLKESKFLTILALFNLVVTAPLLLIDMDVASAEYILLYTEHMRYFAGIAPTILAGYLLIKIRPVRYAEFEFAAFTGSMILFFSGGVISFFITDHSTIIPAHYHGSIVGITIALKGLIYIFLIQYRFSLIRNKLAILVPYLYSGGQFIHILGLAISGGYGALRKAPGVALAPQAKIALAFMGGGGLIALIGGLLFVYLCYNVFFHKWFKESN